MVKIANYLNAMMIILSKGPPAHIFFLVACFCSLGHCLLISIMTLTVGLKVKL